MLMWTSVGRWTLARSRHPFAPKLFMSWYSKIYEARGDVEGGVEVLLVAVDLAD